MNFQDYLKTSALEINQELKKITDSWGGEVKKISPKLAPLNQAFIDASEGGKRLRGTLVKLGYELSGAEYTPEILKPAAAFEIFQTAILAHDDIIDRSFLRRGKPTIYQSLGGDHHAISQTICLGDIGYFLAVRLISESKFLDERKNKAISFFSQAMVETGLGQMLDIELPFRKEFEEETDTLTVFRLKTARYTITGPLHLGAILGGENEKLLKDINEFGENLGIAFQIQDDILGVFGDEVVVGKPITSDIEEGKNTLLIIHALKNASAEQKLVLEKYYGKGKIGKKELEQIRQIFLETGSLEYSKKKAVELVDQSQSIISKMQASEDKKKLLLEIADFLVAREK